jgi:hypothetical protein
MPIFGKPLILPSQYFPLRSGENFPPTLEAPMPRRVLFEMILSVSFLALTPVLVYSHGGGLDAYGCHNDRKHGGITATKAS